MQPEEETPDSSSPPPDIAESAALGSDENLDSAYCQPCSLIAANNERVRQQAAVQRRRQPYATRPSRFPDLALPGRRFVFALVAVLLMLGMLGVASAAQVGLGNSSPAPETAGEPEATATVTVPPATATVVVAIPSPVLTATLAVTAPVATISSVLDDAWKVEDWPHVITIVEGMTRANPSDTALKDKLFSAYFNYAAQLVRNDRMADAISAYNKALAVYPSDGRAVSELKLAQLYLLGSTELADGDFDAAISPFRTIYDSNPGYRFTKTRLYAAYIGQAAALEKSGKTVDAYDAFQEAVKVDAQGAEAQAGVSRLKGSVSQAVGKKKLEVDITKQQVTAWEGDKVIYRFKASTGKAPYLTRKGNFEILSKMPNAYSTSMKWGMPWWMGIYYAGHWENGFHAMARVGTNQVKLSDSLLGRPQTHGCIMMSDANAKTLYDWAVIGTPVWIH